MITAAPVIGSNPTSGLFVDAAAQVAFFRGDPSGRQMTRSGADRTGVHQ